MKDPHPAEAPVAYIAQVDIELLPTRGEVGVYSPEFHRKNDVPLYLHPDPEVAALRAEVAAKQARIDALMFEYCPDEMTPEQIEEWARHQKPVSESEETELRAALEGSTP